MSTAQLELKNSLWEKLSRGEVVASMIVRLVRTIEIVQIARTAGFDAIFIDLEQSTITVDAASQICLAALTAGVTPLVRVATASPEIVAQVLNAGALGVIAPHIHNAEEARAVVSAAKFPPLGLRSISGQLPHLGYRTYGDGRGEAAVNGATMVIPMLESLDALDRVEEIAAVEGVDMILIGTNDLSADLGVAGQYDHPRVRDAYTKTIAACNAHGKYVGIGGIASRPDIVEEFVKLGARFVSTGADLSFLLKECTMRAAQVHKIQLDR